MVGQFYFCGDLRRSVGAGVGEDAGCGLIGGVGGVLIVVEGDADEQGAVEYASFGWFAPVVWRPTSSDWQDFGLASVADGRDGRIGQAAVNV